MGDGDWRRKYTKIPTAKIFRGNVRPRKWCLVCKKMRENLGNWEIKLGGKFYGRVYCIR